MVIDLFTAPKISILLSKSKNFLCKGGSAPLATTRRRKLLRSFRGLCVNSATFGNSDTFAFILTCHKKTWEEPCSTHYNLYLGTHYILYSGTHYILCYYSLILVLRYSLYFVLVLQGSSQSKFGSGYLTLLTCHI